MQCNAYIKYGKTFLLMIICGAKVLGSDREFHFIHKLVAPHGRMRRSIGHTRLLKADPLVGTNCSPFLFGICLYQRLVTYSLCAYLPLDGHHRCIAFTLSLCLLRSAWSVSDPCTDWSRVIPSEVSRIPDLHKSKI